MNTARRLGLPLLLAGALAGCYHYRPVSDLATLPPPGREIRIRFDAPRAMNMGSVTLNEVSQVEGETYRVSGDTLAVSTRWLRSAYGSRYHSPGAVFALTREEILLIEERRLNPLVTGLVAAGAVAALAALLVFAADLGGGSNLPDNGGEVFSIRFPFH